MDACSPQCFIGIRDVLHATGHRMIPPGVSLLGYSYAGTPQQQMAEAQVNLVKARMDRLIALKLCYETVLGDPDFAADCLAFYRSA